MIKGFKYLIHEIIISIGYIHLCNDIIGFCFFANGERVNYFIKRVRRCPPIVNYSLNHARHGVSLAFAFGVV